MKHYHKRLTNKMCVDNLAKINGKVIYSGANIVQVRYENGELKTLTYNDFMNKFSLVEEQKLITTERRVWKARDTKEFISRCNSVIKKYLNKQFPTYTIEFRFNKKYDVVYIDNIKCGYISVGETLKISYFVRVPNPLLNKYRINWWGMPKLNLSYEFSEVNANTLTDLYLCLNELIFAHTQNIDKFIAETRQNEIIRNT